MSVYLYRYWQTNRFFCTISCMNTAIILIYMRFDGWFWNIEYDVIDDHAVMCAEQYHIYDSLFIQMRSATMTHIDIFEHDITPIHHPYERMARYVYIIEIVAKSTTTNHSTTATCKADQNTIKYQFENTWVRHKQRPNWHTTGNDARDFITTRVWLGFVHVSPGHAS